MAYKLRAVVVAARLLLLFTEICSVSSCPSLSDGSSDFPGRNGLITTPSTIPPPTTPVTSVTTSYTPINPPMQCGQSDAQVAPVASIIGGVDAAPGQFPWQVLLFLEGQYLCGGVLIHEKWVITVAHCCPDPTAKSKSIVVYMGSTTNSILVKSVAAEAVRNASRFINHPGFSKPPAYDNDYCLVEMESAVKFSPNIRPICLASSHQLECNVGQYATISGFGYTISGVSSYSNSLKFATVQVKDRTQEECGKYFSYPPITNNMICAGGGPYVNTCVGDSGGPLVCQRDSVSYLSGLSSFGSPRGCVYKTIPKVFARIYTVYNWIKSYVPDV